ncbi:hypothetical protein RRG08_014010 [Elysia crispata]|uniref:Uncharacterized protein n=1 Tax=Elysia crispata TaxID=231223 RepID=A0AAE1B1L9_9GAST|nr:hypothetical protein RRG08_014010 [Elysia crispata]
MQVFGFYTSATQYPQHCAQCYRRAKITTMRRTSSIANIPPGHGENISAADIDSKLSTSESAENPSRRQSG